jgi:hypothetical protein
MERLEVSRDTLMVPIRETPAVQYLTLEDQELLAQCHVDRYRSHGPGGQKRNKTSSAVRLRHQLTGLSVKATEDRSQQVNLRRAIRRLRKAIALHVRTELDTDSYVTSEEFQTCLDRDGRLAVSRRDRRYASVISELLDVLSACDMRVREAAKLLGISTGRFVKFIQKDSKLWGRVGEMRAAAGLKPLR